MKTPRKEEFKPTIARRNSVVKSRDLTLRTLVVVGLYAVFACVVALATPGSGILVNVVSRATVGPFHVMGPHHTGGEEEHTDSGEASGESDRWHVELHATGISDIVTQSLVIAPGGATGWHSHPGPVFVSVESGTLTSYESDDPTCTPHVLQAGEALVEHPGHVHIVRNEGAENLVIKAMYIVQHDSATRIDQPIPGNCPF